MCESICRFWNGRSTTGSWQKWRLIWERGQFPSFRSEVGRGLLWCLIAGFQSFTVCPTLASSRAGNQSRKSASNLTVYSASSITITFQYKVKTYQYRQTKKSDILTTTPLIISRILYDYYPTFNWLSTARTNHPNCICFAPLYYFRVIYVLKST